VTRILNAETLTAHGNLRGRRDVVEILGAGLQAADPYTNTKKLVRIKGNRLIVGGADYEPRGSPITGDALFDLDQVGRILVVGAGKGAQQVARAIEETLGDRLTGGQVIAKHGDDLILERIGVTFGAHPVPDEGCVEGCRRILALLQDLREEDLVFTIAANGISSLLTLPVPGVTLDEVRRTTYLMQIERGAPTSDLNPIRNHLDQMKGGRISTHIHPATAIHILAIDPGDYDQLMHHNVWLHTLPEGSTFEGAVAMLKKWNAWDAAPASVRAFLKRADPRWETVKADTFEKMRYRIFGVMPNHLGVIPTAMKRAASLGYRPVDLARMLTAEASQAGLVVATIAATIEQHGTPFEPPCALFTSGELLVTVGQETGIGGRNQEYAISAAIKIAGSPNIVVGAADTDGTDGPGTQFAEGCETIPSLAGAVVDGTTFQRARELGIDLHDALRHHNTTPALCRLDSGIVATHNISLNDLCVTLIMDSSHQRE
jgi:glycerate 2-kinase